VRRGSPRDLLDLDAPCVGTLRGGFLLARSNVIEGSDSFAMSGGLLDPELADACAADFEPRMPVPALCVGGGFFFPRRSHAAGLASPPVSPGPLRHGPPIPMRRARLFLDPRRRLDTEFHREELLAWYS